MRQRIFVDSSEVPCAE